MCHSDVEQKSLSEDKEDFKTFKTEWEFSFRGLLSAWKIHSNREAISQWECTYEKVSDHGPVWVREEVIFQVQEKRNFDSQNQHQMILLNVWSKDFTKKITRSPVLGD